jgi:GDP-4-dehydro-6-deoxy-D-mannose reductase
VGSQTATLLVGASSFIGRNLAVYLSDRGRRVIGTYHRLPSRKKVDPRIKMVRCNVMRPENLTRVIARYRPKEVYYLAAQGSVRRSWDNPIETLNVNCVGGLHLLESLRRLRSSAKVVIASSCLVYGATCKNRSNVNENDCLKPLDPYSLSKMTLDMLAQMYGTVLNQKIVVVRLVNVTGPDQDAWFSIPNFARQIRTLERKPKARQLKVGNITVRRDFLDIRDCTRALELAMKKGKSGQVYNIASGKSRELTNVLKLMIASSKLKGRKIRIVKKNYLMPKDEIQNISVQSNKFRRLTRWRPRKSLQNTLIDILQCQRQN